MSQLEQLELVGSCDLSQTHPNSHTPNQGLPSFSAVSANVCDSQPDPPLHPDPAPEGPPGMQQQSSGRERGGCGGDIQAVGRVMVQLFRGRMMHRRASDDRQVGIT